MLQKRVPQNFSFKNFILGLSFFRASCHSILSNCRIYFDMIGIIESRLINNQKTLQNIDIPNYNISINCLTEGSNGGALIYIKNDIIYKVKNNLKIYQSQKLESVFLEIINSNSVQFNSLIQVKIIV